MKLIVQLLLLPLPWPLRRRALSLAFGYDIHPEAWIGLSLVAPQHLRMATGSTIGHLNVIHGIDRLDMDIGAGISRLNWICGVPGESPIVKWSPERKAELVIEEGGGITKRHYVDCTDRVLIGKYAMVVGMGTQILTHAIDMQTNRQMAKPVTIGAYSIVGTHSVILGGSVLPAYSALGAGSTLRSAFAETHVIYSGVPAKPAGTISQQAGFFTHQVLGQPGARIAHL